MQIACKCEKCHNIFMNKEDDLCIELDFASKKLSFVCRNKNCRHLNVFDFGGWSKKQKHSPLPPTKFI